MTISGGLERLFEIEIANEHIEETGSSRDGASSPGGVNPATLESCLDSIEQGLELEEHGFDTSAVRAELEGLIATHSGNTQVRQFLPVSEWTWGNNTPVWLTPRRTVYFIYRRTADGGTEYLLDKRGRMRAWRSQQAVKAALKRLCKSD
jgi:hypothetical protein